jgi:hypothetical protein
MCHSRLDQFPAYSTQGGIFRIAMSSTGLAVTQVLRIASRKNVDLDPLPSLILGLVLDVHRCRLT